MDLWMVSAVAGLYGLVVGSFLNVCSLRWPVDQSVVKPGSRCPGCEQAIAWFDNIPVLSWVALRGRCRHCGESISVQYPLVELANGLMWAGMFATHGPSWEAFRASLFLTLLFGIALSDARFFIIPDQFSIGGAVVGVAMSPLMGGIHLRDALIGAAVGYGVLWLIAEAGTVLIRWMSPGRLEDAGVDRAMGGGDIKMMMMIGAFLGVWGVALTIFLGSVLALVVLLLVVGASRLLPGAPRETTGTLIPFGVFLSAGAAIAYVWGEPIVRWYLTSVLGLPG